MLENGLNGLAAYDALPSEVVRGREDLKAARTALERQARTAATLFLNSRNHSEPAIAIALDLPPAGASQAILQTYRSELQKRLKHYRDDFSITRAAHETVLSGLQSRRFKRDDDYVISANFYAICHEAFACRRIMELTTLRLQTYRDELSSELFNALDNHRRLLDESRQIYDAAYTVLIHEKVDAQALPEAARNMESVREQLRGSGEVLCMAAAGEIDEGSQKWQNALECADAVLMLTSSLLDLIRRAEESVSARPRAVATASSSRAPGLAAVEQSSTSEQASTRPQTRNSRRRAARRQATAAETKTVGAAMPSGTQRIAERARGALSGSRVLTPAMVMAEDDPVNLARSLGQDTRVVEYLRRFGACPIDTAHAIRDSIGKWFGNVAELRAAQDELVSLPNDARTAAGLDDVLARIKERVDGFDALMHQVTADEIERIKRHDRPTGKHLERLLALGQIERVEAATKLRSEGDTDSLGHLFEIAVQSAPLRDGSPAPALYVHLHTTVPVSLDEIANLPYKAFAKVHVKTHAQKNLGASWEEWRKRLGYDDKVHRGTVGAREIEQLMRIAAPSEAEIFERVRAARTGVFWRDERA